MFFTTITTESCTWTSPGLQRSYKTAGHHYQLQRTRAVNPEDWSQFGLDPA